MRQADLGSGWRGSIGRVGLLLAAWVLATEAGAQSDRSPFQVHGFFEEQVRAIARDLDAGDGWDLTQWYHVLNLEIDWDVAPNGFGPFDLVSAFARVEVRYDCVWTRGCGIFPSADLYGDDAGRLPERLGDGRRSGFDANLRNGDTRRYSDLVLQRLSFSFKDDPNPAPRASRVWDTSAFTSLFPEGGSDFTDQSALFWFSRDLDCRFGNRRIQGSSNGIGSQDLVLDPGCKIEPLGRTADLPNPFNPADVSPITGSPGLYALPYRPAPLLPASANAPLDRARGGYYPNAALARLVRDGEFDNLDQNFRQAELAWNRGASQQDEKELKELYVDLELFDGRLWLRLGKQNIVWGKTELFRTTDQFNPQDLALASLPSLEESRIALWAARGVWSFYDVGPLQDVRLELALNYDQFEPADIGRCGEPYAPLAVCNLTFGAFAHGYSGVGVAGAIKPPNPWNSWSGIEVGGRLEFRYDRFSFALSDFYGYSDTPYVDKIFTFERNVDPLTGRPRRLNARGACTTGAEPACLGPDADALVNHSANQQTFALICATDLTTAGEDSLDPAACNLSLFSSQALSVTDPTDPLFAIAPRIGIALSNVLSGQAGLLGGQTIYDALLDTLPPGFGDGARAGFASRGLTSPLVPLNRDPSDGGPSAPVGDPRIDFWLASGLSPVLTDPQEALLGCGPFFGTSCDVDGVDLLNTEASVLFQAWPGFEGTFGAWDTEDFGPDGMRGTVDDPIQPGTLGFVGGPVCTRFEGGLRVLPGCRGPFLPGTSLPDPAYDVNVDGSIAGLLHPFVGQQFGTELSALSWNLLMLLVATSGSETFTPGPDGVPDTADDVPIVDEDDFDGRDPVNGLDDDGDGIVDEADEADVVGAFRTNGCSYRLPLRCRATRATAGIMVNVGRPTVRAAGNGRFGRRSFVWHAGTPFALRYDKRNVLGFSVDWAEDVTKSNWNLEATWIEGLHTTDNDEFDGLTEVDTYNLTVSVDRPTFINFLNQNRTFFLNSQWFLQYVDNYRKGFPSNGPWNLFFTFTVATGYFQDRLIPASTFVYDFRSNSGAVLPQVTYRFTENFSTTFGLGIFYGRFEAKTGELNPSAPSGRIGRGRDKVFVENGLSLVRERDEVFLRVRYTF